MAKDRTFRSILNRFRKKIYAGCGHETYCKDWVEAYNEKRLVDLIMDRCSIMYCHQCLSKMAIRCAWCGRVIWLDDRVRLRLNFDNIKMPDYARVVPYSFGNRPEYIGCALLDCNGLRKNRPEESEPVGFWKPPGEVVPFIRVSKHYIRMD